MDAFAVTVALAAEDAGQTGWSFDPSKRSDIYDALGVKAAPLVPTEPVDPMNTPPPAHLAEEQLAEFRAIMSSGKPPNPAND
ncbi:MAG: hypothetical protein IPG97_13355 [Microthrixaceae bacterium]|nr:hypothetical protein [Microthrixaceae bacterium]